jgi:UDP-GlcNAc:undecaprenyl-phosphate/decaprenyl-phosphate GlcNAc-1-phosphate transferase
VSAAGDPPGHRTLPTLYSCAVWTSLGGFVLAFIISAALTPVGRWLAVRGGVVDPPAPRKIHPLPIARLGGVGVAAAFGVALAATVAFSGSGDLPLMAIALGGLGMVALGAVDDVRGLGPWAKLAGQTAIATAVVLGGLRIDRFDPLLLPALELQWLAIPATVAWIVGITNAVNLIDGLDGLAAGVGIIATATLVAVGALHGDVASALVAACLCGSLLGFLPYNRHPATVFLGDSGSLFVGFTLAVSSAGSWQKAPTAVALLAPVLVLGLPLAETLVTVARRTWQGAPLMEADAGHMHHGLLGRVGHRRAVAILYAAACILAGLGLVLTASREPKVATVLVLSAAVGAGLLRLAYGPHRTPAGQAAAAPPDCRPGGV